MFICSVALSSLLFTYQKPNTINKVNNTMKASVQEILFGCSKQNYFECIVQAGRLLRKVWTFSFLFYWTPQCTFGLCMCCTTWISKCSFGTIHTLISGLISYVPKIHVCLCREILQPLDCVISFYVKKSTIGQSIGTEIFGAEDPASFISYHK